MRSIADSLRQRTMATDGDLTVEARIERALLLGDADAQIFAEARGVSIQEARRLLARQRQQGRTRSACHESLLA